MSLWEREVVVEFPLFVELEEIFLERNFKVGLVKGSLRVSSFLSSILNLNKKSTQVKVRITF